MKKYSLFIGRWQPWHSGHLWLIEQRLNENKNVCVAIRDVPMSEEQPWSSKEIKSNIEDELKDLIKKGIVKVIIIPDIESINYGREVGYDVIEHVPPPQVRAISATEIRRNLKNDGIIS
jgi:nicotinamide mononucleotide adenylyltransferase